MGALRDTLSLTPATKDTSSQEVLQEHVSLMDHGQEVQLLAQVSVFVYVPARMTSSMLFAIHFCIRSLWIELLECISVMFFLCTVRILWYPKFLIKWAEKLLQHYCWEYCHLHL